MKFCQCCSNKVISRLRFKIQMSQTKKNCNRSFTETIFSSNYDSDDLGYWSEWNKVKKINENPNKPLELC